MVWGGLSANLSARVTLWNVSCVSSPRTFSPASSWKDSIAANVAGPKTPSTGPGANPSLFKTCCATRTLSLSTTRSWPSTLPVPQPSLTHASVNSEWMACVAFKGWIGRPTAAKYASRAAAVDSSILCDRCSVFKYSRRRKRRCTVTISCSDACAMPAYCTVGCPVSGTETIPCPKVASVAPNMMPKESASFTVREILLFISRSPGLGFKVSRQ